MPSKFPASRLSIRFRSYWEDFGDGKGRVTITCYGEAWTAYWPAMGTMIREFFLCADDDYLANRLQGAQFQKHTQGHLSYLKRIVRAIKDQLRADKIEEPHEC